MSTSFFVSIFLALFLFSSPFAVSAANMGSMGSPNKTKMIPRMKTMKDSKKMMPKGKMPAMQRDMKAMMDEMGDTDNIVHNKKMNDKKNMKKMPSKMEREKRDPKMKMKGKKQMKLSMADESEMMNEEMETGTGMKKDLARMRRMKKMKRLQNDAQTLEPSRPKAKAEESMGDGMKE